MYLFIDVSASDLRSPYQTYGEFTEFS